jgi:hypothetical protein
VRARYYPCAMKKSTVHAIRPSEREETKSVAS